MLLEEICKLAEQLSSVLGCLLSPATLKSLAGGGNGNVDILLGSLVDGANNGLVGGVDDLEGLAVYTFDELVVDEPMRARSSAIGHRRRSNGTACGGIQSYLQSSGLLVLARVRRLELDGRHDGRRAV